MCDMSDMSDMMQMAQLSHVALQQLAGYVCRYPNKTRRSTNADYSIWTNIKPTLFECLVFAGMA